MAMQERRKGKIGSLAQVILTRFGVVWLVGSLEQVTRRWDGSLGMPVRTMLEALPSIFLAAWHVWQPCALLHLGFLEGLLEISASCWLFVLTLARVA
jgi:hypothetical protein